MQSLGAMFLASGTRHILEKLRIYYLSGLLSKKRKKDPPKFRNWKQMKSD